MVSVNTHFNRQYTFGSKYERFTLTNLMTLKNSTQIKFSKDGGNSVFSSKYVNDENKEDIEKIYKLFDSNSDKDGNLTYQELYDGIEDAIWSSVDVDNEQHINIDDVNKYFKDNGIELKDPGSFLAFIKAAEELADFSKNAESGNYKINEDIYNFDAEKDESDPTGRTYNLKDTKSGKTYRAAFGGQNSETQKMVSEFYAKAFNNPALEADVISFNKKDFGNVLGITIPDVKPEKLDKNIKLGLDVFFSNNETKDYVSYSGTLDQTSRGLNTSFSFIPYEFSALADNKKYNRNNIIAALKTISEISDEDIKSTLAKYNNTDRYENTLLKRKEFCAEMLKQAQKTPQNKGEATKDYVQRLEIYTMGKFLKNIDNPADLKPFDDSVDTIEDKDFQQSLKQLIDIKREELNQNTKTEDKPLPITRRHAEEALKKYGYVLSIKDELGSSYTRNTDEEDTKYISKRLGDGYTEYLKDRLHTNLDLDTLTARINIMHLNGIDVLKDKEAFDDFMIYLAVMKPKKDAKIDKNTYEMVVNTTKRNIPNPKEQEAISFYKDDATYLRFHVGTDGLLKNDIEPTPEIKEKMEVLNNYLHKHKTKTDIHVYRGEHAGIFDNIKMSDGSSLGVKLMDLSKKIPEKGDIPKEIMDEINEVIDFVNNNPFDIENTRFCSTSIDKSVADNFHEVGLDLDLPAGSSAACIDAVNFDGKESGEGEVLASYGSIEQITGAKFDPVKRRITFTGKLITDTNK